MLASEILCEIHDIVSLFFITDSNEEARLTQACRIPVELIIMQLQRRGKEEEEEDKAAASRPCDKKNVVFKNYSKKDHYHFLIMTRKTVQQYHVIVFLTFILSHMILQYHSCNSYVHHSLVPPSLVPLSLALN